jgi:rhodanese-related sulfurtransferase
LPTLDYSQAVPAVRPAQLAQELADGRDLLLLDVRRVDEYTFCHLPDSRLITLDTLPARLFELPRDREIVVVCHHGNRSSFATRLLRAAGFDRVRNLTGGIDAWSHEVDPNVPRY